MDHSSLIVNGIDLATLSRTIDDASSGEHDTTAAFGVRTVWCGQTLSRSRTTMFRVGGDELTRNFEFGCDEPPEFCGADMYPNPQEYLLGAVNACLIVGYAAGAALRGIKLESLEIETSGELDLRGFLGIDSDVPAGYRRLDCKVRIRAKAGRERLRELHEVVTRTSPNFFNLSRAVRIYVDLTS